VTDFLAEKRREIDDRLVELKPLVTEYERLEAASKALAGVPASKNGAAVPAARPTAARRRPGRPPGSKNKAPGVATSTRAAVKSKPAAKRRVGRRKGSGQRGAEALAFVTGAPGITVGELAAKMGIKQNYLYRVLPGLEQEKKIEKQGRGWHPAT
jgi:hypothetical protein